MVQLASERMKLHSSVSRFSEGLHDYTELFMLQLTAESESFKQSGKNTEECLSYRMQTSAYHSCLTIRRWGSDLGFFSSVFTIES